MNKYVVRFNQNSSTGYIENEKTLAEAGIFYSQVEGLNIIDDMVNDKAIEINNALDLIHDITYSSLLLMPKTNIDSLKAQLMTITYMYAIRGRIERKITDLQFQGKTCLSVCERCGLHGYIYYNGTKSEEVNSKMEALQVTEKLSDDDSINLIEKESLIEEIEKSRLQNINLDFLSHLN